MRKEVLRNLLNNFDIPEKRKDIEDLSNVKWLLRNIWIKNADTSLLQLAVQELKKLLVKF